MRGTGGNGSIERTGSGRIGRISSSGMGKSPGELDEHDYSLSVSDLNGSSLHNTSGGGVLGRASGDLGASLGMEMAPKFRY